jgi:hypothetical protein
MREAETQAPAPPSAPYDPSDVAMCARARERFAADRRSRIRRRRRRGAALPNLVIIGGLKCGTTSLHHYLGLHPEVQMSRPKELNFFVAELNSDLGLDWYESRFDDRFAVRGESSPHYTNLPRFHGVAGRIREHLGPDVKLIYMVRDPIKRILSHWVHATGAGYETRPLEPTLSAPDTAYVHRSQYWMQLQPFLELFDRDQIEVYAQEELERDRRETMRMAFRFAGVDESFTSEQFDREWEKSSAKQGDKYKVMERMIKLPGLRSFDRNFDRLPESMRWVVEKIVHDPEKPPAPKPELDESLLETLRGRFHDDVAALQRFCGRQFPGWHDYG